MGKIKVALHKSPKEIQFEERAQVRKRVEITARRGVLDLEVLEWIAKSYAAKTHAPARRYAFRLAALWRAGHFSQQLAARGSWTALEEKTKSLWFDGEGQVVTRQSQAEETKGRTAKKAKIRRERAILGEKCAARLLSGKRCKNLKVLGANRCYRHGGKARREGTASAQADENGGDRLGD